MMNELTTVTRHLSTQIKSFMVEYRKYFGTVYIFEGNVSIRINDFDRTIWRWQRMRLMRYRML
jgi:hypothetical protein